MKELENIKPDKEVVISAEEKSQVFKGSHALKKGHSVWQWRDGVVSKAEYGDEEVIIDYKGKTHKRHKLLMDKGVYYIPALNLKNAKRKFKEAGLKISE